MILTLRTCYNGHDKPLDDVIGRHFVCTDLRCNEIAPYGPVFHVTANVMFVGGGNNNKTQRFAKYLRQITLKKLFLYE